MGLTKLAMQELSEYMKDVAAIQDEIGKYADINMNKKNDAYAREDAYTAFYQEVEKLNAKKELIFMWVQRHYDDLHATLAKLVEAEEA